MHHPFSISTADKRFKLKLGEGRFVSGECPSFLKNAMIDEELVVGAGNDIIVTPMVEEGQRLRSVVLPKREWTAEDGTTHNGGASVEIKVLLKRLAYFVRM